MIVSIGFSTSFKSVSARFGLERVREQDVAILYLFLEWTQIVILVCRSLGVLAWLACKSLTLWLGVEQRIRRPLRSEGRRQGDQCKRWWALPSSSTWVSHNNETKVSTGRDLVTGSDHWWSSDVGIFTLGHENTLVWTGLGLRGVAAPSPQTLGVPIVYMIYV